MMYGGASKLCRGRGGGGGGGVGPGRNRNSFPLLTNRHPSPGREDVLRQRNKTSAKAAAATLEETFSLVPRESISAFGMIIRLAPDLVEEIKRVEAQGGRSMRFLTIPLGMLIIIVGGKEFKFTWSRERGDLCDIYEEHQSGEDGEGLLIESGCAWRKLNVQRTLDESTTSHMKMRSVEAVQRIKSRNIVCPLLQRYIWLFSYPISVYTTIDSVGDRVPNAEKKIELILKKIANFQAPRYFLKPGTDSKSYKKHSPDSICSPKHQQSLPITECSRDQLHVPGRNGEVSQDCLPAHLVEQLNAQESVDILHHSPGILHEEKLSGNRDGQARSSSDSDSESDNSDSGNDSGSSSDSEASSNKESSDEEVDIMSDGDKEPQQSIQSAERFAIDLPGHGSDVAAVEGDAADFEGHDSDPVDIDGHSSDEDHCSEADRKKFSDDNWKMEARTGTTPTTNEEVGISGQEQLPSGDDNLRERQNFIGQMFDYTDNTTNDSLTNDQRDISERLGKDQDQIAPALDHYSQQSARVKNMKYQQLPAAGRDSEPSERKCDAEYLKAFATQMIDPLKGLQQSLIQKLNGPGQMKPVDSSGIPNTRDTLKMNPCYCQINRGHFPHETISSRSGKAFRDNHRDDVHSKNKFPMNKKDDESAFRLSLPSNTSNRKLGDPKNVSGLSIGSSPLDSQRAYSAKLPKGNGLVLQKQDSDLELGELPEPLSVDTSLKQFDEKNSFRHCNNTRNTSTSENLGIDSDKRRSKTSVSTKPALTHASSNGIQDLPQQWALQSHGHNLTCIDTKNGSQDKKLEDAAYKARQKETRVGNSVEGYGETKKKTHGSKRASTSRSSKEGKKNTSGKISNSINGHKDATPIPGDSVVREKRMTSFNEEDSSYLKYKKSSHDLKRPISDHLQYKAYMPEYLDKYDSYCSIHKILDSYRNDFQKLGKDLTVAKGRDMEKCNKIVEHLKESYCKYGERQKRLKKVFVVLHEELKQLKQRMKNYASSDGKD
ncbi:hypothetical protein Bca101_088934 [Brassica carinata]